MKDSSFLETYHNALSPLESRTKLGEREVSPFIVCRFWMSILKIARRNNIWALVRLAGRHMANFDEPISEFATPSSARSRQTSQASSRAQEGIIP